MIDLDITFDPSPWEKLEETLEEGGSLSALELLQTTEEEEDEVLEDIFTRLEQMQVTLDVETLPANMGYGQTAVRLRQEQQMAQKGDLTQGLDENDTLRLYLQQLPDSRPEPELEQQFLAGRREVASELLSAALHRVVEEAEGFTGRGVLLVDLIQEGSLGLWQGLQHYTSGDLHQVCRWWIRQYMARAIVMAARSGGLMEKVRHGMEDYRDVDGQLLSELGRSPTLEEIAERMHVSVQEAESYQNMISKAQSRQMVDKAMEEKEETPEDEQAVEDTAYFQVRERIVEMLETLEPRDVQLLTLRFGLDGQFPQTPQEAAGKLGMTSQELVEREAQILQKLRQQG